MGKYVEKIIKGNNLYFPEDIECPINDIFIDNQYIFNKNYTNIKIGTNDNTYLHYTNKKIDGEIILDLRLGIPNISLQFNYEKSNELCKWFSNRIYEIDDCKDYYIFNTVPFYKNIDTWNIKEFIEESVNFNDIIKNSDVINFYAIEYQGINSTLVNNTDVKLIRNLNKNMKSYKILSIIKIVFLVFNVQFFIFFLTLICEKDLLNFASFIISIIILILEFIYFILAIFSYKINKKYIQGFMNKINKDFEEHKINNTLNLVVILFIVFYIIMYSLFFIFLFLLGQESFYKYDIKTIFIKIKEFVLDKCLKCCKNDNNNNDNADNNNNNNEDKNTSANDISQENYKCCFCLTNPSKIIMAPCGHQCCCKVCYERNRNNHNLDNCPICRRPVQSIVEKIFKI